MEASSDLAARWRSEADFARNIGAESQAAVLEKCAAELEAVEQAEGKELLNLTQAALRCGYSADALGRMIREGRLTNHGRKNAPRVRASDLPRKVTRPATPRLYISGASRQKARMSLTTTSGGS